jgi:hypothetical protein
MKIVKETKKMKKIITLSGICLCVGVAWLVIRNQQNVVAQSETTTTNFFVTINEKAKLARSGDAVATDELVTEIFRATGAAPYLAGLTGSTIKDRIKRAEIRYRQGQHAGISEANVVSAVNALAQKLGTPEYSKTVQSEVRRLRVKSLPVFPELIGKNRTANLNPMTGDKLPVEMSPAEAAFVFGSLLYQKMTNPDYQLTVAERTAFWEKEHDEKAMNASLAERSVNNPREKEISDAIGAGLRALSASELVNLPKTTLDVLGLEP